MLTIQTSRLRPLLVASFLVFAILISTHRRYSPSYYDDVDFSAPFGRLRSQIDSYRSTVIPSLKKPRHCVDPYREQGLFYYPTNDSYKESRWIPYTKDFYNLGEPEQAKFPADRDPVFHEDSKPEQEWLDRAPRNWMKNLVAHNKAVKQGEEAMDENGVYMDWIRNRRVLLLGDSVARYQLEYWCQELDAEYNCYDHHHKSCGCHAKPLNVTVFEWHIPGMFTHFNKTWWWMGEMELVSFESRWEAYHKQTLPQVNGLSSSSPDMIIFYSGLWDERAFRELARSNKKEHLASPTRHITWEESRFFASRLRKFIKFIRGKFGDDVPLMYQSLTSHKESKADDLAVFDLDRILRFLCKQMGVEVFDWYQIIKAHSMFWKDDMHPGQGPVSWLWSNMLIHYLFRAVGGREVEGKVERLPEKTWKGFGGWEECHEWNI